MININKYISAFFITLISLALTACQDEEHNSISNNHGEELLKISAIEMDDKTNALLLDHLAFIEHSVEDNTIIPTIVLMYTVDSIKDNEEINLFQEFKEVIFSANSYIEETDPERKEEKRQIYEKDFEILKSYVGGSLKKHTLDADNYDELVAAYLEEIELGNEVYHKMNGTNSTRNELNLSEPNNYGTFLYTGIIYECDSYGFSEFGIDDIQTHQCVLIGAYDDEDLDVDWAYMKRELDNVVYFDEHTAKTVRMKARRDPIAYRAGEVPFTEILEIETLDAIPQDRVEELRARLKKDQQEKEQRAAESGSLVAFELADTEPRNPIVPDEGQLSKYLYNDLKPYIDNINSLYENGSLVHEKYDTYDKYYDDAGYLRKIIVHSQLETFEMIFKNEKIAEVLMYENSSPTKGKHYYFLDDQLITIMNNNNRLMYIRIGYQNKVYIQQENALLEFVAKYQ